LGVFWELHILQCYEYISCYYQELKMQVFFYIRNKIKLRIKNLFIQLILHDKVNPQIMFLIKKVSALIRENYMKVS